MTGSLPTTHDKFEKSCELLFNQLKPEEHLTVNLTGEEVDYLRFNKAQIRQATHVQDACLSLEFIKDKRSATAAVELHDLPAQSQDLEKLLTRLRSLAAQLPEDPYAVLPEKGESSHEKFEGRLPTQEEFVDSVLRTHAELDVVGIQQSGTSYRGVANSTGLRHWFETDGFATDYSIFHPSNGKAVKGTFAGKEWRPEEVSAKMNLHREVLGQLNREAIRLKPGHYRTYMEPAATADMIGMFSYRGVSEAAIRQGESALLSLFNRKKSLSDKFSLVEDFSAGLVPRFNESGELAPEQLSIIAQGQPQHTLISPRTAKEHNLVSNGATHGEGLRAAHMGAGKLVAQDALKALGTGVYISNLHYLNWSDVQGARVTGMTRYACMWVENGEFVAPISDMRFDESLFDLFGHKLESCTSATEHIPNVSSYGGRQLGGCSVPGVLVNDFTLTL